MATFKIDELRQSVGITETISMTSQHETAREGVVRVGQVNNRTIPETRALIKSVVTEAKRPMTRKEIFAALERKNTPHMRKILTDLVDEGVLVQTIGVARVGIMPVYWYTLP
jgi:hypothetical protein